MPRNIEIKARIDDVEALIGQALAVTGGQPLTLEQDDTFFAVPHGRLKLRQFADGSAELIHYHRPDSSEAKASDHVRAAVPDAAALREALLRGCGLLGRVHKTRHLLIAEAGGFHTRIHIDRVQGLGDFMELEVVLKPGQTDDQGIAVAQALMSRLGLAAAPRLAGSYLDLMGR